MENLIFGIENHRSRERVKEFGEVFTSEEYINKMLSLFEPSVWSNEEVVFVEPTCGHGNFVCAIFKKRVEAFVRKYTRLEIQDINHCSIANALNTLWAIDVCAKNVTITRKRLFIMCLTYLDEAHADFADTDTLNFIAHILCAINWQIQENEALSSLTPHDDTKSIRAQTEVAAKWLNKNGRRHVDPHYTWCSHFDRTTSESKEPKAFLRATEFLEDLQKPKQSRAFPEFDFARDYLLKTFQIARKLKVRKGSA